MRKEERIKVILKEIDQMFPDAKCELNHSNALELLIAVVLSAQTTDKSVNIVTADLFKKYQSVEDYANASIEDLENDLKKIGLYKNKSKNIKLLAQTLIDHYDGNVPNNRKDLMSLPGVGRKTANVVLSVIYDFPALAVDTHVERISKRLKLAKMDDSVLDVERKLCKVIPRNRWNKTHHQFIFFGRYFCKATNPSCQDCPLYELCVDPIKLKKKSIKVD